MDLSPLLAPPEDPDAPRHFVERVELLDPRSDLGDQLLADAFRPVWDGDEVDLAYEINNADRAIGAALSGAVALEYGELPPRGTARVRFTGSAGQSFGAFLTHGVELDLVGEANDYVGKGMGGGRIVIRPPANDAGDRRSWPATPACTAPPAASCSSPAAWASASASATRGARPWSRAPATTAAST